MSEKKDYIISPRISKTIQHRVSKFAVEVSLIFQTKCYDLFKFFMENRPIRQSHVIEIIKSMTERYIPSPIIVTPGEDGYYVVDGQHRLKAVMELSLPLYFQVVENLNMDDMVRLNKKNRNWNPYDYLHHYVARRFEHYITIYDFWHTVGLEEIGVSDCVAILVNTNPGGAFYKGTCDGIMAKYRDGLLEIPKDGVKKGKDFVDHLLCFSKYTDHWAKRNFIHAVQHFWSRKEYDPKRMIRKCALLAKEHLPTGVASVTGFGDALEDIYNHGYGDDRKFFINWKEAEIRKKAEDNDDGGDKDDE